MKKKQVEVGPSARKLGTNLSRSVSFQNSNGFLGGLEKSNTIMKYKSKNVSNILKYYNHIKIQDDDDNDNEDDDNNDNENFDDDR